MKKYLLILGIIIIVFVAATSVNYTRLVSNLTVNEKIVLGSVSQEIVHDLLNETVNYKSGADKYDVDNVYADTTKNTQTVDLTSLTNTLGQTLDLTGDRIVAAKFKSRLTNTGTITIEPGVSNGYDLLGASFKVILEPGQSMLYKADTMLTEIGASDKTLLFTCGSDTLDWIIITADLN
ncbi:MAG: hypothetical protein R6U65_03595 [Perlabentimonas sp.]